MSTAVIGQTQNQM